MLGWKGFAARRTSAFGEDTDAILTLSPVPVLVCRPSDLEPSRVVLSVIDRDLAASARALLDLAQPGDVVIVAVPPVRTGLGRRAVRLADALPDRTLLLVAGG